MTGKRQDDQEQGRRRDADRGHPSRPPGRQRQQKGAQRAQGDGTPAFRDRQ
jgi:hypothetical protein